MVPLVHISGKPLEFIFQTADALIYISVPPKIPTFWGRPAFWRRANTMVLGPLRGYATPRHREIARTSRYIFFSPFRSFATCLLARPPPRKSLALHTLRPTRYFPLLSVVFEELAVFLETNLSSCYRTSVAILGQTAV